MLRTRLIASGTTGLVLAGAFAAFATVIVLGPTWIEPLRIVPGERAPMSLRRGLSDPLELRFTSGVFVRPGEVVDPATSDARIVERIERARRPPSLPRAAAVFLLY